MHASAIELPLVEEAEAGREERDGGRGPVLLQREHRCGARLVVVLQEPRRVLLELRGGPQVLAHGTRVPGVQAVVEPLVVGEVEPCCCRVHSRSQYTSAM